MFADEETLAKTRARLDDAAEHWGVELPSELVELFACPRISPDVDPDEVADGEFFAFFEQGDLDDFCELADLYPAMPLRTMPLLQTGSGDCLALYVPRGERVPVLTFFDHEEGRLAWLTDDVAGACIDPDRYAGISPRPPPPVDRHRHRLLIDPLGDPVEELGKALACNRPLLEDDHAGRAARQRLVRALQTADGPLADLLQRHLAGPERLLQRRAWQALAAAFAERDAGGRAITAAENALVLGQVAPHYGEAQPDPEDPSWTKAYADLQVLEGHVAAGGDRLDHCTLARNLAVARSFIDR